MKICIFGSSGYLGASVSNYLENFYTVTRFSSGAKSLSKKFDLNSKFDYNLGEFDCIIYFSWLTKNRNEVNATKNIEGLNKVLKKLNSNQIFIFISSMSVLNPNNTSIYSQSKKKAEEIVLQSGHIVLRPGMVLNLKESTQKGMAKNIFVLLNLIRKYRIPIQFNPDINIAICSVEKLNFKIKEILENKEYNNVINIQENFSVNRYILNKSLFQFKINLLVIKLLLAILSKVSSSFADLNDSFKLYT